MPFSLRWVRLRAAWLFVVPCFWLARPTLPLLVAGAVLSAAGLLLRGWAAGTIDKGRRLTTAGPYAHTRNPLYLGSFLLGMGFVTAVGRWPILAVFLILFAAVYGPTVRREATALRERFPDRYAVYEAAVPLFLPRIGPHGLTQGQSPFRTGGFALRRYARHREWEALVGTLAGFAILTVRWWLG